MRSFANRNSVTTPHNSPSNDPFLFLPLPSSFIIPLSYLPLSMCFPFNIPFFTYFINSSNVFFASLLAPNTSPPAFATFISHYYLFFILSSFLLLPLPFSLPPIIFQFLLCVALSFHLLFTPLPVLHFFPQYPFLFPLSFVIACFHHLLHVISFLPLFSPFSLCFLFLCVLSYHALCLLFPQCSHILFFYSTSILSLTVDSLTHLFPVSAFMFILKLFVLSFLFIVFCSLHFPHFCHFLYAFSFFM